MDDYCNRVNDWLVVGADLDMASALTDMPHADVIAELRSQGVTHVLDARSEWQDRDLWVANGLERGNYCHAPIIDSHRHSPDESWYEQIEAFVDRFWAESEHGESIYVHCHMGVNRGPSAAMLALLSVDPLMSPLAAFLTIREARPMAGLVYAEAVGRRHLSNSGDPEDDLAVYEALQQWQEDMRTYWTGKMNLSVNRGIAYYRDAENLTLTVGA